MKELRNLIPIWAADTPPSTSIHENDFLMKLSIQDNEIMYGSVNWCAVESRYYFEPVILRPDPENDNRLLISADEAYFSNVGLQLLKQSLQQMGITHTRRVFDIAEPAKDYLKQLAEIHPSLVPNTTK